MLKDYSPVGGYIWMRSFSLLSLGDRVTALLTPLQGGDWPHMKSVDHKLGVPADTPELGGRWKDIGGGSFYHKNSSFPGVDYSNSKDSCLPPPHSSPLAFSLGWLTLGKQVLHYAWLPGMRSVLVSNSLPEQPQGHRPRKNPSCSTVQKAWARTRKHYLSHNQQMRPNPGPASSQVCSPAPGRNTSVNNTVSAPPPEAAQPRRGCRAAFRGDFLQLAPSVPALPDVLTEQAA